MMSLYIGLLLTFLLGYSLIELISFRFTALEKLGLSFPVGLSMLTILMLLLDQANLLLSRQCLLISETVLLIMLNIPVYNTRHYDLTNLKERMIGTLKGLNLLWLFFIVMIVYFEYMNLSKCLFFPTFDRDSLAGFDTIGYVIAQEHTFKGLSLFKGDYMPAIHGAGSYITYAPMVQLSYAFVYLLGDPTSKIIPGLFFLCFLIAFYGVVVRVSGRTGAAICTFSVLITPTVISFSSFSITNVIHAVLASLAVIYFSIWFRMGERKDLLIAAVLLGANVWCRTEGIVFTAACLLLLLIDSILIRQYKNLVICTLISVTPAIIWSAYLKINGLYAEGIIHTGLFWNAEKMRMVWYALFFHYQEVTEFGFTFFVFAIALLANVVYLIKSKDQLHLLAMIFLSTIFYSIILYQIDYKWDSIDNVLNHSVKRFLICFVPMVWFYVISNRHVVLLLEKLDRFLSLNMK